MSGVWQGKPEAWREGGRIGGRVSPPPDDFMHYEVLIDHRHFPQIQYILVAQGLRQRPSSLLYRNFLFSIKSFFDPVISNSQPASPGAIVPHKDSLKKNRQTCNLTHTRGGKSNPPSLNKQPYSALIDHDRSKARHIISLKQHPPTTPNQNIMDVVMSLRPSVPPSLRPSIRPPPYPSPNPSQQPTPTMQAVPPSPQTRFRLTPVRQEFVGKMSVKEAIMRYPRPHFSSLILIHRS